MRRVVAVLMAMTGCLAACAEDAAVEEMGSPQVELVTNHGKIVIKLYPDKAPITVENFLTYVDEGFYDGTIFHRIIDGFMVQGGGMDAEMNQKPNRGGIKNEAANGLKNKKGTIAMARTSAPHSASSQFFINLVDNVFLNYKSSTPQGFGYCVFGKVVEGMNVVEAMGKVKTSNKGYSQNVPVDPVILESASRVNEEETESKAVESDS